MSIEENIDLMSDLIWEELAPHVVKHIVDPRPRSGHHVYEHWHCNLCGANTPIHRNNGDPTDAGHIDSCKLGMVLGAIERERMD